MRVGSSAMGFSAPYKASAEESVKQSRTQLWRLIGCSVVEISLRNTANALRARELIWKRAAPGSMEVCIPRVVLFIVESLQSPLWCVRTSIFSLLIAKTRPDPAWAIGSKEMDFELRNTAWTSSPEVTT